MLALGLAHVILARQAAAGRRAAAPARAIDGWAGGLADYAPDAGRGASPACRAHAIERLARELAERKPAVAIVGGAPLAQTNGLFTALAVNALNALLGASASRAACFFTPQRRTV